MMSHRAAFSLLPVLVLSLAVGCDAPAEGEGEGDTGEGEGDTGEGEGEGEGEGDAGEGEGEGDAGEGEGEGEGDPLTDFSFFVASLESLRLLSGNDLGFGGDFSYGESGPGAGLRGADKLCNDIADISMPGASAKGWHAFLSVTDDGTGAQVDAIDRIGAGPWFDRLGRLVANDVAELQNDRPSNADGAIVDDLPNEFGVPNHQPDPTQPEVDNHHVITGSDGNGRLFDAISTCGDWTDAVSADGPRVGLSWPRNPTGGSNARSWLSALTESGCAPGVNLIQNGPGNDDGTVGSGGGYGAIYCFALAR